ncbi:hypothetical protein ACP70R_019309 [Stipagrostis hirtigluma subsp. patula]
MNMQKIHYTPGDLLKYRRRSVMTATENPSQGLQHKEVDGGHSGSPHQNLHQKSSSIAHVTMAAGFSAQSKHG